MLTIMKLQPDTIVIEVVVVIISKLKNIYEKERNLKKNAKMNKENMK